MLKLTPNPTFTVEVEISVPGQTERTPIKLEFQYRDKDAYNKWAEEARKRESDAEIFKDTVLNWSEVDSDFTRENFARMLNAYPAAGMEIWHAYRHHSLESRRKNSQGPLLDLLAAQAK